MAEHMEIYPLMGANACSTHFDSDKLFVSPKLDGMRGIWDGRRNCFFSRTGQVLTVPKLWTDVLPEGWIIDGELYMGEGKFTECGIFRGRDANKLAFRDARFMMFDCFYPAKVADMPLTQRLELLKRILPIIEQGWANITTEGRKTVYVSTKCPIKLVNHILVESSRVNKHYQLALDMGYEGLMVKNPESKYLHVEKSNEWFKMKPLLENEGVIVGYRKGHGKYDGLLGAFSIWPCVMGKPDPDGIFHLSGMTTDVRINYLKTHPIGTVVTYIYEKKLNNGKPRFPRYKAKRGYCELSNDVSRYLTNELVDKSKFNETMLNELSAGSKDDTLLPMLRLIGTPEPTPAISLSRPVGRLSNHKQVTKPNRKIPPSTTTIPSITLYY